jgi:F-type H+-transporting ATPase subunit delta
VIDRRVTIRYVQGLIEASQKNHCVDEVWHALKNLDNFIEKNSELTKLFYNPAISRERKKKVLRELISDNVPDVLKRFMDYIIDKKREKILESLFKEYKIAADRLRGIVRAKVVTAAAQISREQDEKLKIILEKFLNKKIEFEFETEKSLVGGLQVIIGTYLIDGSVNGRLNRLHKHLLDELGQLKTAA